MDLLKKNSVAQGANAGQRVTGLDAIRESLKRSPPRTPHRPPTPFLTPQSNIFNPELQRNLKAVGAGKEEKDSTIALLRHYSYEELGKRLGELRPAVTAKDGKEWFSLKELQGRIARLAELEKQENRFSGQLSEIKNCIGNLNKQEKPALPLNIPSLLNLGGQLTLDYMSRPPQEELLEKVRLAFCFPGH
jgi:small subunit ribosomal protein S15